MYRIRVLAFMVIIAGLGLGAVHYFQLPFEPEYYTRAISRTVTGFQKEFGNAGFAAILFATGIFGFLMIQRRT